MEEQTLRAAAINVDADGRATRIDIAEIWHGLVSGVRVIADSFYYGDRLFLVLRKRSDVLLETRAVCGRRLIVLEQALLGKSHKAIAIDLCVSPSAVSNAMREALQAIGWTCAPSKVPLIAVILVHAARDRSFSAGGRMSALGDIWDVVSVPRADLHFPVRLPNSVEVVVRHLVEGRTYAEIAQERRVSTRTVANQVAWAYRRLGISGRMALLVRIATGAFAATDPALHGALA